MKIYREKINLFSLSWFVLIWYFCLYEFTTEYSPFNGTIVNYLVLGVLAVSSAIMALNFLMNAGRTNLVGLVWLPFIILLIYQRSISNLLPTSYVLIYVLAILMIFFPPTNEKLWDFLFKTFKVVAIICAIGVLLQIFLPSVHSRIVSILLKDGTLAYIKSYEARGYYSGFLHQVGGCAFYLAAGIIAEFFSHDPRNKKILLIAFLGGVLLLQGKRSIFMFLIVAILLAYVLSESRSKKASRIVKVSVISILGWVFLQEAVVLLSDIKLFEKLAYTIQYLQEGDITGLMTESGREHLYELAQKLFEQNPMWGIGWGEFSVVAGNVYNQTTSVHNIYLQLLCETGIIGLIAFLIGAISSLLSTVSTRRLLKCYTGENKAQYETLFAISLAGQLLVLLFGFVENPIYNENALIFYFLLVILNFGLRNKLKYVGKAIG